MTIYEAVKHTVPVPDAAARYGLDVSRNGMARCPFHKDNNPSMKLNDDYFFCFGCGERGDVIDLTAGLYGLNNYDAVHKLADDFGVGYETVILDPAKIEQKRLEREREQEKERQVFLSLTERLYVLRDWIVRFAPKSEPEALDEELDIPPSERQFGVAPAIGAETGPDGLRIVARAAYQRLAEELSIAVLLEAEVQGDALRQEDMGEDAARIPRVPALRQGILERLVGRGGSFGHAASVWAPGSAD